MVQAALAAAAIAAVAAISPAALNMFPPQGAQQPGQVAGGGGVTPVVALAVRIFDFFVDKILSNMFYTLYIKAHAGKRLYD
jgi:hypothetical protein